MAQLLFCFKLKHILRLKELCWFKNVHERGKKLGHIIIKDKAMNYKPSKSKGHYDVEVAMIAIPDF